jgi:hypothetical protein
VRALQLSAREEQQILSENFLRLIEGVVKQAKRGHVPSLRLSATIAWEPEARDPWQRPAVAQEISGTCCG